MPDPIPDSTPILLATSNPAKQRTLRWLLEGLPLSPVSPQDLGLDSAPEEEGDTHEAIARLKAREWSMAGAMLAIASDGGLVIPALGGRWESRFTHRFAEPAADDAERLRRLLELLRPYRGAKREASWVEALAIAGRGRVLASWEVPGGSGLIANGPFDKPCPERSRRIRTGSGDSPQGPGFWVFSVWYFPQFGKTYNQLSPEELASLDDHWTRLRELVQHFFRYDFAPLTGTGR